MLESIVPNTEEIISINVRHFCRYRMEREEKNQETYHEEKSARQTSSRRSRNATKALSRPKRNGFTIMRHVSLKMSSEHLHGAKGFSHIYRPTVLSVCVSHNSMKCHTHSGITLIEHSFQVPLFWHARQLEVISKMHNGPPGLWREFGRGFTRQGGEI